MVENLFIVGVKRDKHNEISHIITQKIIGITEIEDKHEFTIEEIKTKLENSTSDNPIKILANRQGKNIELVVNTLKYKKWTLIDKTDDEFHLDLLFT